MNKLCPAQSALRRVAHQTAVIALCAAIAGCASQPAQPPAQSPPQPAAAVSANGTYNGLLQLVRTNGGPGVLCGTQATATISVAANTFHYILHQPEVRWQPIRAFDVRIAPDGSFLSQSGTAYIQGRVAGGHMQGEIAGDVCTYRFEADKSGTW